MIRNSAPNSEPVNEISPEDAIISLIAATPTHQIQGKKRVQKLLYLCVCSSAPINARFKIRHYGVFSSEVADALDDLCVFGDVNTKNVQVGPSGYFSTLFSLPADNSSPPIHPLIDRVAKELADSATSTLEVASTVAYFMNNGFSQDEAIANTEKIKPLLTTTKQIERTKCVLSSLSKLSAEKYGQRPTHP